MYQSMAQYYDYWMNDVAYDSYATYFEKLFEKHLPNKPKSIVDIGCGTGVLTQIFHQKGYDMIGVDISEEMLSQAIQKYGQDILWIAQDMTELDLFGTVDVGICFLDGINHITTLSKLHRFFQRLFYFIEPGGIFLFDVNTPYKFENIYDENIFYSLEDEICYIWENCYNRKSKLCEMDITYFIKDQQGSYERKEDHHVQRSYTLQDLQKTTQNAGFLWEGVYHDQTFEQPKENSERIFVVIKKPERTTNHE